MSNGGEHYPVVLPFQVPMERPAPQDRSTQVPPRVRMAWMVFQHTSEKTCKHVYPVNGGFDGNEQLEIVEGDELNIMEANLQGTASSVLQDYMLGNINLDVWERQAMVERQGKDVITMPCFACDTTGVRRGRTCDYCNGAKQVDISPHDVEMHGYVNRANQGEEDEQGDQDDTQGNV